MRVSAREGGNDGDSDDDNKWNQGLLSTLTPFMELTAPNVIRKRNLKMCTVKPITVSYMERIPFMSNYHET